MARMRNRYSGLPLPPDRPRPGPNRYEIFDSAEDTEAVNDTTPVETIAPNKHIKSNKDITSKEDIRSNEDIKSNGYITPYKDIAEDRDITPLPGWGRRRGRHEQLWISKNITDTSEVLFPLESLNLTRDLKPVEVTMLTDYLEQCRDIKYYKRIKVALRPETVNGIKMALSMDSVCFVYLSMAHLIQQFEELSDEELCHVEDVRILDPYREHHFNVAQRCVDRIYQIFERGPLQPDAVKLKIQLPGKPIDEAVYMTRSQIHRRQLCIFDSPGLDFAARHVVQFKPGYCQEEEDYLAIKNNDKDIVYVGAIGVRKAG